MRLHVLTLLLLAPAVALGQTSSLDVTEPSRGTQLPPTGAALADEATAIAVNPAGLSAVGTAQLFYLHERSLPRNQVADGLYLGGSAFGMGGAVSVDWLRSTSLASYRKTGWGLSLGSPNRGVSLGAAFNFFASDASVSLDRMMTVDLGLLTRPTPFFSVGATVKNLNTPLLEGAPLGRRYDVGVGVRPFGERFTLGIDYLFPESGLLDGRLSYVLQAEVYRGLRLGAGFAHGVRAFEPQIQLALTFDTPNFGVTYAGGVADGGLDHVVAARLSTQRYREFSAGEGRFALIDLDDRLAQGSGTLSLLGVGSESDPFIELVRFLEQARRDPELKGVVLKIDTLRGVGQGRIEELRQTVLRFRASGKKVVALVLSAGDTDYLLASAADRVLATPGATFIINGFAAHPTFLGGTMEKLDVAWNVARVGAYKGAPDALTRTGSSAEERETVNALLATDVKHFKEALEQGRKLSGAQVDALWNEGLLPARRAQALGLVDEVLDPQKLDEALEKLLPDAVYDERYSPRGKRDARWGDRRRVAIIPVIGNISGGKSREGPLGSGLVAGAETVIKALDQARRDPRVAAIVLRVDSGGGDGLSSDLMYRAVVEARGDKPVVASMGDVAASGGYYIAMGADEIYASPTTITGSIGVFILKPAVKGLAEKLGITQESIKTGPLADLNGTYNPWTPEEQTAAQRWVDSFYDDFITEVARSRKLDKAKVDSLARGRVWSGEDAKARGLVDTFGGLAESVESAKKRAGVPASEDVELVVYGEAHGLLAAPGGEPGVSLLMKSALEEGGVLHGLLELRAREELPPGLKALAAELGLRAELLRAPGVKAMMPFTLQVE